MLLRMCVVRNVTKYFDQNYYVFKNNMDDPLLLKSVLVQTVYRTFRVLKYRSYSHSLPYIELTQFGKYDNYVTAVFLNDIITEIPDVFERSTST